MGLDPGGVGRLRDAGGSSLYIVEPGCEGLAGLTTPLAFVSGLYRDQYTHRGSLRYAYHTDGHGWILFSPGPDRRYDIVPARDYDGSIPQPSPRLLLLSYDPTNGTASAGDVWRVRY